MFNCPSDLMHCLLKKDASLLLQMSCEEKDLMGCPLIIRRRSLYMLMMRLAEIQNLHFDVILNWNV